MTTNEINDYLKRYEIKIRKEVGKRLKNAKKGNIFDSEDIVQEVMVYLWRLLRDRYDPSISSPNTFIQTHLIYSIYKAIKFYNSNITYTGKDTSRKRSGTKLVDNSTVSLDFNHFDTFSSDQKEVHKYRNPTYNPDWGKVQRMIMSVYGSYIEDENDIIERIYCDQVINEVRKRLTGKELEIFEILIDDGENIKLTIEETPNKCLGLSEIAEQVGYTHPNTVGLKIKSIRKVVEEVIKDLE